LRYHTVVLAVAPKETILVIEDDEAVRSMLRTALQSAGYAVVAVEDGLSALQRIEQDTPSAVVLDMALPRLSGRDVHRELAARPDTSQIPIVVVSGSDLSDLNPSEFSSVLRKPVHPDAVVFAVENGLRRRRRAEPT
jgi:CheY-like chemotaxis protein